MTKLVTQGDVINLYTSFGDKLFNYMVWCLNNCPVIEEIVCYCFTGYLGICLFLLILWCHCSHLA